MAAWLALSSEGLIGTDRWLATETLRVWDVRRCVHRVFDCRSRQAARGPEASANSRHVRGLAGYVPVNPCRKLGSR